VRTRGRRGSSRVAVRARPPRGLDVINRQAWHASVPRR
jgi:hypothetical protein